MLALHDGDDLLCLPINLSKNRGFLVYYKHITNREIPKVSEDQKKQLQTQLWNIANELRGKMGADEFRDYILGFIFYKYLSEKIELFANSILKNDGLTYEQIIGHENEALIIEEVQKATIDELGYFLKPNELFHHVAKTSATNEYT